MAYIDGCVAAVPTGSKEEYVTFARQMAGRFRAFGALGVVEAWGDDVPDGVVTSFPMAVKCKPDETVVFSWITWPSRAARDAGWEKLMADPEMAAQKMPFDGQRMIFGGFEVVVDG